MDPLDCVIFKWSLLSFCTLKLAVVLCLGLVEGVVVLKSECLFIGKCCVVWFLLEVKILKKGKQIGKLIGFSCM